MMRRLRVAVALTALGLCSVLSTARADLLGYYTFEGNLEDLSGNGHHGVFVGDAAIVVDPERGNVLQIPNTGHTHGVNINTVVPYAAAPAGTSFTLMAWYKRSVDTTSDFRYIVSLGANGNNPLVSLGVRSSDTIASYSETDHAQAPTQGNYDQVDVFGNTAIEGGAGAWQEWHHLAVVYDRSTDWAHVYLDGVHDGSTDISDLTDDDPDGAFSWVHAYIGRGAASTNSPANGWIDDVRIYDEALTWQQIRLDAGIPVPEPATIGIGLLAAVVLGGMRFPRRHA